MSFLMTNFFILDPATENCSEQTSLPEGEATLVVDKSPATAGISTGISTGIADQFCRIRLQIPYA